MILLEMSSFITQHVHNIQKPVSKLPFKCILMKYIKKN
jgi:hypothetical protein